MRSPEEIEAEEQRGTRSVAMSPLEYQAFVSYLRLRGIPEDQIPKARAAPTSGSAPEGVNRRARRAAAAKDRRR